jgi:hypothetical protein
VALVVDQASQVFRAIPEVSEAHQRVFPHRQQSSNNISFIFSLRNGQKVTVTKTTITKPDGSTEVTEKI